jgi:hypothetical protein
MSKIDILLLRREMQNIALNIGNYTQEELKDLLFRAIEVIDELRTSKETIEAIKYDFNEKLLEEAKREIAEAESKEKYSILDRIKSLENAVYDF